MQHQLISQIEQALSWAGPHELGRAVARGRMSDDALPGRLLTPQRLLDLVMRRSLTPPQFRCVQDGNELHPRHYIDQGAGRRAPGLPQVDMGAVGRLLDEGATFVLDGVDRLDPTMEAACRALQWWAGELVQVNCYLTTRDAAGFELHWDDHDVLVVQLAGRKSWEVRGASRPAPMYRDAVRNDTPSDEIIWAGSMVAGDVLHIPRGYWHRATRTDRGATAEEQDFSLHATFGLTQRTGVDWVTWLADRAREDLMFRTDLDPVSDSGPALARQLSALAETASPHQFLASRVRQQPPRRRVITSGVFGPPASVVCITEFPPQITAVPCGDASRPAAVLVEAAGRAIRFAAAAEPALRMLLSGHPVQIAEVEKATSLPLGAVAATLITEGLCAEALPELSSGYTGLVPTTPCSTPR
ncbi:cupin domain-containing protein (plasmid) [Pseudonocardia sp. DSM 110487]|uniref:cupin domain-containing protein n=1 Tax=Pseudonocardia sp. DSM 110487 TaxID=2865833 RepID=UPI001C696528|nr:cupin domain-containing protein [Pseudonocardia sp. DSM 110487]QYN41186.1 cupin domain-containing protein [Pseudonocardia sp. DSM 110487]